MNELTGADFKSATAMTDDNKKLFIETYGCQMNVADSEVIASVMQMAGYSVAETLERGGCGVYEYLFYPRQCRTENSEPPGVFSFAEEEERST